MHAARCTLHAARYTLHAPRFPLPAPLLTHARLTHACVARCALCAVRCALCCAADLGALGGPQAQAQYSLQISIAAALGSVIVTCLATSPFELLRLRAIEAASADALVSDAPAPTPAGAGQMPGGAPGPASPTPPPAAASATPASGSIARPLAISDDLETSAAEGATTLATLEPLYQYNASSGGDLERDLDLERERDAGGSSSNSTRIECVLPQVRGC